jgi:hypothetical protein
MNIRIDKSRQCYDLHQIQPLWLESSASDGPVKSGNRKGISQDLPMQPSVSLHNMDKFDVLDQIAQDLPNQPSASLGPDRSPGALSERSRMSTRLDDPLLYTAHCTQAPLRRADKCTDVSVKHKLTSEENMQAF